MAHSNSRARHRRDTTDISNRRLPVKSPLYLVRPIAYGLRAFEDRRTWHPDGPRRPARSFNKWNHRLTAKSLSRSMVGPYGATNAIRVGTIARGFTRRARPKTATFNRSSVAFQTPSKVLICVRRKQRKEVLFAKRKTGRGGQRRPRFNYYSSISCRR